MATDMTRRMSCSLTIDAVKDGTKTVTRRHVDTWRFLVEGDRLTLIEKGMGLPKGSKQVELADVEITNVRVEPLSRCFTQAEVVAEGFPAMSPADFVDFWLRSHGYKVNNYNRDNVEVRRIAWRYRRVVCPECDNRFEGLMPGHVYGSNWDWVPCQTCGGVGLTVVSS